MGDDIGWMQVQAYADGMGVGETPNIDRIGKEGARFVDYVAMQSCTSGRNAFFTGMYPLRTGITPPSCPGRLIRSAARYSLPPCSCAGGYTTGQLRQEPPRRSHSMLAHGARLPRLLGLPLTTWDATRTGELPRHQQFRCGRASRHPARTRQSRAAPRCPGAVDQKTTLCLMPPRPVILVQLLRRHGEEPDLQGRGPADAGSLADRRRGDLREGRRLPRPQRPEENQQALLRLVQPGAHARRDDAVAEVRGHAGRARAARTGASTKPA